MSWLLFDANYFGAWYKVLVCDKGVVVLLWQRGCASHKRRTDFDKL